MSYTEAVFHFYTGTGNSYRAACWLRDACARSGVPARMVPVRSRTLREAEPTADGALVGLVTPTHGFTAPWLALCRAARLPHGRGAHAVIVPTRAGTKFGRVFLPGLEGTAGYLLALILALKGYRVRGVMALDMPSNWTEVHPGFAPAAARAIIARAEAKAGRFMETILRGGRRFAGFVPFALGLALAPVSLAFLLYGRFILGKLFYPSTRCTGCGLCARACPAGAIRMCGRRAPRPYWTLRCENCMRCMNFCPERAVEASYPLAVAMHVILSWTAWMTGLQLLTRHWPALSGLTGRWPLAALNYVYFLLVIAASYAVFHLLVRIRAVNRLLTALTLTTYMRRYREPDTTVKDLL